MKRLLILLLFMSSPAQAACFCACYEGKPVPACTKAVELVPANLLCDAKVC